MALNCKKQATSTSSSGDHAFHNNRVYSFEDVSLQSRSISKSSHELKNVFITISNILTSFTISQNFTLEEKTQFSYLKSLCDFGLNLIQDINTVDKLDYTLRHNNKQSTNPFYIVRDTSVFKLNDDDNEFNLIEVLEFCLKMFQARQYFDHKNISFLTIKGEYEINTKTRISCINHIRLRQVIINLLSNSYKFTQRGEIKLHCFYNGNKKIRISIRDTGTGMSVSYIKSLFEPYSGDTINQKYNTQGTGLGLCIVKEILEAFNIELHYTSQTGKGTEFWFDLDDNSTFNHEDEPNNPKNNVIDQQALITQSILKMMDEINSLDKEGIILKQNELNSLNKSFEGSFDDNTEIMNDNNNNCINTLNHMFPKKQNFSYSKTTNTNLLQWNKKRETTCIHQSFAHTYVGFQQKRCNTNPEIKEMISEMLFIKQPKKYNIFVCDDEKQIALSVQNLILKYFKKRKLFDSLPEIYLMRDGIECLFQAYQFYLENNQCNLIILDQNMDFLKGEETCQILKRIKQLENIKVFLMTGENPNTFDNCSADGIITKPLSFTTIENILKLQNFK